MQRRVILKSSSDNKVDSPPFNLLEIGNVLLHRKKTIFWSVIIVAFIAAGILMLIPNKYVSIATILPTGNNDKMNELKALAGLGSLIAPDDNSSELFPVILQSQWIRDAVLAKTYSFKSADKEETISLKDYFGTENPDKLRRALMQITSVSMDKKTGVICLGVETKYPSLSQEILKEYLVQLDDFVLNKQRSGAKENARYLATQMAQIKLELERAETDLEAYQQVNRDWAGSGDPQILKNIAQMQREIEIKSQTYAFLYQQFESAKLDVQKDVPIVRVLDQPTLPTLKSGPKRIFTIILFSIMAFLSSIFYVLFAEALKNKVGNSAEPFTDFRENLAGAFPRTANLFNRFKKREFEELTTEVRP